MIKYCQNLSKLLNKKVNLKNHRFEIESFLKIDGIESFLKIDRIESFLKIDRTEIWISTKTKFIFIPKYMCAHHIVA